MFLRRQRCSDPTARHLVDLGLAPEVAATVSQAGTVLDLPAGTTLVRQGERGDQAFLLVAGSAQVLTPDGVVPISPGAIIGELATLDRQRVRNATVITDSAVTVLVFDVATYRALAHDDALRPVLAPTR